MPLRPLVVVTLLTAAIGIAGYVIPVMAGLETNIGLDWLFNLRGPREPPSEVVVLGIGSDSARALQLPQNPRKWPRDLHARAVDGLRRAGARVVAFDLIFEEFKQSVQDQALAVAIERSANVILFQYLERAVLAGGGADFALDVQRMRNPLPSLVDAAAGLAPFPLPNVGSRVDAVWTFKPGAGDVPTMPAVALQQFALPYWRTWLELLRAELPGAALAELIRLAPGGDQPDTALLASATRMLFSSRPGLADGLRAQLAKRPASQCSPAARRALAALIYLYSQPDSLILDHYGAAGTLPILPYHVVLTDPERVADRLRDRAVFIGYTERVQQEQKDSFRTFFAEPQNPSIGGVELAATVFANLLEQRTVRALPPKLRLLLIPIWAVVLALAFLRLAGWPSVALAAVLALVWVAVALLLFTRYAIWTPIVGPLLYQLPVALIASLSVHYMSARDERRRMHTAFARFVPERIVQELTDNLGAFASGSQSVYAVCMSTDVERYTELAERLNPETLHALLNRYYQVLFEPVRGHHGVVANVVGDSMMALWADRLANRDLFERAALAAIEIQQGVRAFNAAQPEHRFTTRIGLHCGPVVLGHVGTSDRFEYRPVGDIVNTAARIETLGKQLGVYTLASEDVVRAQHSVVSRELGSFLLLGKGSPVRIHELIGLRDGLDSRLRHLIDAFGAGLALFRDGQWTTAGESFEALLGRFPNDGPSRYYRDLCRHYREQPPPADWGGVIVMQAK